MFVSRRRWTFSRTMPKIPHEYTVKGWEPENQNEFESAAIFIREHGTPEKFWNTMHIYLYVDGWKYWTMGAPIPETVIINRAIENNCSYPVKETHLINYQEYPAIERTIKGDSVAFYHDITKGKLPDEYSKCDCIYSHLPSEMSLKYFDVLADCEDGVRYKELLNVVSKIIQDLSVPTFIISNISALKSLPEASEYKIIPNDNKALLYCYNTKYPFQGKSTEDLLENLALRFNCIGDFCCGHGEPGRTFKHSGKEFVMSDCNKHCVGYIDLTF